MEGNTELQSHLAMAVLLQKLYEIHAKHACLYSGKISVVTQPQASRAVFATAAIAIGANKIIMAPMTTDLKLAKGLIPPLRAVSFGEAAPGRIAYAAMKFDTGKKDVAEQQVCPYWFVNATPNVKDANMTVVDHAVEINDVELRTPLYKLTRKIQKGEGVLVYKPAPKREMQFESSSSKKQK